MFTEDMLFLPKTSEIRIAATKICLKTEFTLMVVEGNFDGRIRHRMVLSGLWQS